MTNDTVNPSQQPPQPGADTPAAATPTPAPLTSSGSGTATATAPAAPSGPTAVPASVPGAEPAGSTADQEPSAASAPFVPAEPSDETTAAPASDQGAAQAQPASRAPRNTNRRRGERRNGGARAPVQEGAAPAAAPGGEAPRPGAARRPLPPLLDQLAHWHPQLFGAQFLPLKRGIFHDLMTAHGEAIDKNELKQALAIHTRSTRYLTAVASGQARHDLQGQPVEAMAPEHVHHALLEVFRRRKPRDGEDWSGRLRRRIAQAFEASGLTRMAYDALVRGRDEQANVLLDEALAEVAERDARAEALLRAYEASGATPEAFADMYGMERQQVGQSLARARRLREATAADACAGQASGLPTDTEKDTTNPAPKAEAPETEPDPADPMHADGEPGPV